MLSHRLIKLIETHAESLAHEVVQDAQTNEHTRSHALIPKEDSVLAFSRSTGTLEIGSVIQKMTRYATSMRNGGEFAAIKEFLRVKSSSA
jgi:hypothetical protein